MSSETAPAMPHSTPAAFAPALQELRESIRGAELLIDVLNSCDHANLHAETAEERSAIVEVCEKERTRRRAEVGGLSEPAHS